MKKARSKRENNAWIYSILENINVYTETESMSVVSWGQEQRERWITKKHNLGGVHYPDLRDGFPSIHICQKSSNCIL